MTFGLLTMFVAKEFVWKPSRLGTGKDQTMLTFVTNVRMYHTLHYL